ncbi:L,D-transpeptidase [Pseudonocardia sp. C8]|uniref:L,D-transpeptidase n=1 Tax=Pseudonocardia sp. C8 TaxID=2762759 RepID=UPI00164261AB|nr:L,D-transpeptidase [Pseudonocardia sp. C8]MBC3194722.1 L,D-transpeptidase [Pseudonocardia sp. C8]
MDTDRQRPRRIAAAGLALAVAAGLALAGPAVADSPAADRARSQPQVPGTPCSVSARACVDLESQRSWLIQDGKVIRGPIRISSGGNGQETPVGHSLRVYRKEADHKSQESRRRDGSPAPMPWSVFFDDGGIAFHSGDPNRSSAGCIHLPEADAKAYFDNLQIGDQVQVVRASEEAAARRAG